MGTLMEILCEFPYGNPVGILIWEFPQKTRGNGMGMGIEIPFLRQPCLKTIHQIEILERTSSELYQSQK